MESQSQTVENSIKCTIKDISQFKICLESVTFPKTIWKKNDINVSLNKY